MVYKVTYSSRFKKDFKKISKSGKMFLKTFREVLKLLSSNEVLPAKYRDHLLKGAFHDCRECHLAPDLLLVYQKIDNIMVLYLMRIGSHSELF